RASRRHPRAGGTPAPQSRPSTYPNTSPVDRKVVGPRADSKPLTPAHRSEIVTGDSARQLPRTGDRAGTTSQRMSPGPGDRPLRAGGTVRPREAETIRSEAFANRPLAAAPPRLQPTAATRRRPLRSPPLAPDLVKFLEALSTSRTRGNVDEAHTSDRRN